MYIWLPSGLDLEKAGIDYDRRGIKVDKKMRTSNRKVYAIGDVAGGLRSLGNANIVNSTFSGNVSTAWHGGGIFHTDGTLTVDHSTFAANVAPAGTASGILVATFGAPASMTVSAIFFIVSPRY